MHQNLLLEVTNESIYENEQFKTVFDKVLNQEGGPFGNQPSDYFQDPNGSILNDQTQCWQQDKDCNSHG